MLIPHTVKKIIVLTGILLGGAISQTPKEVASLEIFVEVKQLVLAGEIFSVFVSSNDLVRLKVTYGHEEKEVLAHDSRTIFAGLLGTHKLKVAARDLVGNTVVQVNNIVGVRVPPLEIQAPEVVYRGDPYVVKVTWTGIDHGGGWVEAVEIVVDEEAVPVFVSGTSGYALSSVPLDSEDQVIPVISRIVDEFGRGFRAERLVRILDHPEPVVDLDLGREILDSLNQENRDLEEALLHEAYARTRVDRIWQEPFQMPVEGQITSRFGQRRRYATSWPVYSHLGIDIAAKVGTEIRAANSGVVVQAGFFPIRGGASIIDHGGGLSSLYFHQSRVGVEVGDFVERGGIIGQVGSTGVSTGPHLHWEVRLWGIPTNPIAWFDLAVPRAPHENY